MSICHPEMMKIKNAATVGAVNMKWLPVLGDVELVGMYESIFSPTFQEELKY